MNLLRNSSVGSDADSDNLVMIPNPNDVLCGQDMTHSKQAGNLFFKAVIEEKAEIYHSLQSKKEKMAFTTELIRSFQETYQSRFLQRPKKKGTTGWNKISEKAVRDKFNHALRFADPSKKQSGSRNSSRAGTPEVRSANTSTASSDASTSSRKKKKNLLAQHAAIPGTIPVEFTASADVPLSVASLGNLDPTPMYEHPSTQAHFQQQQQQLFTSEAARLQGYIPGSTAASPNRMVPPSARFQDVRSESSKPAALSTRLGGIFQKREKNAISSSKFKSTLPDSFLHRSQMPTGSHASSSTGNMSLNFHPVRDEDITHLSNDVFDHLSFTNESRGTNGGDQSLGAHNSLVTTDMSLGSWTSIHTGRSITRHAPATGSIAAASIESIMSLDSFRPDVITSSQQQAAPYHHHNHSCPPGQSKQASNDFCNASERPDAIASSQQQVSPYHLSYPSHQEQPKQATRSAEYDAGSRI